MGNEGGFSNQPVAPRATTPDDGNSTEREISFEYAPSFVDVLEELRVSLLVSTYQAGKLAVVSAHRGQLMLSFHNFERAMGIAARADRLAVGAQRQVWFLDAAPDIAPRLPPPGSHDACFLTRSALFTGEIQIHELAFGGRERGELWCVNTLFCCLCTLDERYSFVPRWRPKFISALAAEDRCHLNGFALGDDGQPAYVTVISRSDTPQGWRANKVAGGELIDVRAQETVLRELSMPHSPRWHRGSLWVLDSGRGRLLAVDHSAGMAQCVAELPGYTRGMAMHENVAFIGLSRIRESNVFGGLPIAQRRAELKCGVGAIDLKTGRLLAHLEFKSGVEEIFALEVLSGVAFPALSGPYPHLDGTQTIWNAPAQAKARE
jgi:uncharacterized protein (TIGR03032 family)